MTALQVIMREGQYSLATIGLLNLVRVPWTIKFLWSPFVDRHCVTVRDYKRTIIVTELIYAVALLATGLINVRSEIMLVVISGVYLYACFGYARHCYRRACHPIL